MRKYFGTDGIRGVANTELSPELVYKAAKAGAYVLSKHTNHVPTILIGRDTRISGNLIESALVSGFLSYGANVKLLGIIPTPAVAYLTRKLKADAGVMISASHNPYEFNGIKFFSNKGMKIPDELEEEIEEIMDSEKIKELSATNEKIGTLEQVDILEDDYVNFFEENFASIIAKYNRSKDFVIGLDVANGATYKVAEKIFKKLGLQYKIINNNPDGININNNCGSTHLDMLKKYVVKNKLSIGFAYDGDGDRCLAVDEKGNEIDGDKILAIVSSYLKENGNLKNNTIVATVMSNLGLSKFSKENGFELSQTKVGDRYVLEEMLKQGHNFGGEQSGHIILLDYNPTGDGILTSIMVIQCLLHSGKNASDLGNILKLYPQVLVNAKVDVKKKYDYEKDSEIKEAIDNLEKEFAGNGRVLIRPSGTEPLVRVMIEGEDLQYITKRANDIAELITKKCS